MLTGHNVGQPTAEHRALGDRLRMHVASSAAPASTPSPPPHFRGAPTSSPSSSGGLSFAARGETKRMVSALESDGVRILPPLAYARSPKRAELKWAIAQTLPEMDAGVRAEAARRLEAAANGANVGVGEEYALDVLREYNCEIFSRAMPEHPACRLLAGLDVAVAYDCDYVMPQRWEDLSMQGRRLAVVLGHHATDLLRVVPHPGMRENAYPFLIVQDAPPGAVGPQQRRYGSDTAKLDLFTGLRLALRHVQIVHEAAVQAVHDGDSSEDRLPPHTERTRQVFGILSCGKYWELYVMRLCSDGQVIAVREWEGVMDRPANVVECQRLVARIVEGEAERLVLLKEWMAIAEGE